MPLPYQITLSFAGSPVHQQSRRTGWFGAGEVKWTRPKPMVREGGTDMVGLPCTAYGAAWPLGVTPAQSAEAHYDGRARELASDRLAPDQEDGGKLTFGDLIRSATQVGTALSLCKVLNCVALGFVS